MKLQNMIFSLYVSYLQKNKTFIIHYVFSPVTVIDQMFIQRLLLSGQHILVLLRLSHLFFSRALSLTVITKYGRTGMDAVINIVSAAVGLVVLWIMKMFTCFLKKCHISQWSRLISIVCNKYTYQYLQYVTCWYFTTKRFITVKPPLSSHFSYMQTRATWNAAHHCRFLILSL